MSFNSVAALATVAILFGCSSSTNTTSGTSAETGGATGASSSTGGSGSGGTTGGCDGSLCGGACCATVDSCINNACCPAARVCAQSGSSAGTICCPSNSTCVSGLLGTAPTCEATCVKPSDCSGSDPCCKPAFDADSGAYTGSGNCGTAAESGFCICAHSSDCAPLFLDSACVPTVYGNVIVGPDICVNDDGKAFDGCVAPGDPSSACASGQKCTTDKAGNQFCSTTCGSDSDCGNVGVACCNGSCGGGKCCGICSS